VQQRDCDALRFAWWSNADLTKDPADYQMVHFLRFTCSLSIAKFCPKRVATDYGLEIDSDTRFIVLSYFYKDVCLISFHDDEATMKIVPQVCSMLTKCGFKLTKRLSNCQNILETIPEALVSRSVELELKSGLDLYEHVLGVHRKEDRDAFGFKISVEQRMVKSREELHYQRFAPCTILQVFLLPVMITATMFMHKLCCRGASWDKPASEDEKTE